MNKLDKIRRAAKLVDALENIQNKQQFLEGKKLVHIAFKGLNSTSQASYFIKELMELDIHGDIWKDSLPSRYKMTEQRIKEIDERFWPFAVEVEE